MNKWISKQLVGNPVEFLDNKEFCFELDLSKCCMLAPCRRWGSQTQDVS